MNDVALQSITRWKRAALVAGLAGSVACVFGFVFAREQFWRAYFFAVMYWTGMGLGCLGVLMLHHTVGGKWGVVIRRLCEAGARTLPFAALLFIPILLAMPVLYKWASPGSSIPEKAAYLNVPFFIGRTVFYFCVWTMYAYVLSRWSSSPDARSVERMKSISAPGLVVFMLTATFAFIDWIMSLTPDWYSTMFGAMFIVGQVLSALALVVGLFTVLARWEPISEVVMPQHFHDLGNLLLAFTALWAYLSFSQFLIIWSGNLPEEVSWYVERFSGPWAAMALLLVVFHFFVPFLLLLQRDVKRRPHLLLQICGLMLAARLLDTYWVVAPSVKSTGVAWMDLVAPVAVGALWLAVFFWQLGQHPLLPLGDVRLQQGPRETVAY